MLQDLKIQGLGLLGVGLVGAGVLALGALTGGIGWGLAAAALGTGLAANELRTFNFSESETDPATGADLLLTAIGMGRSGSKPIPVKILPLMRQGAPWVAALRGYGRGRQSDFGFIVQRVGQRVSDAVGAYNAYWGLISDLLAKRTAQEVNYNFTRNLTGEK
jgi:hypothetical protein